MEKPITGQGRGGQNKVFVKLYEDLSDSRKSSLCHWKNGPQAPEDHGRVSLRAS